jgi:hypothetical protein
VLSDRESRFVALFQRTGPGFAREIPIQGADLSRAVRIERPDLLELHPLSGSPNTAALREEALALARALFRKRDTLESTTHVLAHPHAVNCDGIVAEVEIRSRTAEGGAACGFETIVRTGSSAVLSPRARTQERRTPVARPVAGVRTREEGR